MQSKLLLSTAITAAMLAACSDDKPAEKKSEPVKLAAVSAEQMADEAEARYKSSSEAIADSEYRREGSSAIATITRPLPLQESAEPVTLTVTDTITYGQELRDQGVIARVERRITPHDALVSTMKALAPLPVTDENMVNGIAGHLQLRNDLLADNNIRSTFAVTSFQTQDDGNSFDFKGMQYETYYNEKSADIFDGQLNVEPITMTSSGKEGKGGTATLTAVKGNWGNKADGSAYLNVDPIKIEATDINGLSALEIAGIKGSGSGVAYDDTFGAFLGKGDISINNIRYTNNGRVTNIGDIILDLDNNKTAVGNYNSTFGLTFKLDGVSLQQSIPMLPVAPKNLRLNVTVNDISARANTNLSEAMQLIGEQTQQGSNNMPAAAQDKLNAALTDLIRDKTRLTADLLAETDSGSASVNAHLGIRKDSSDSAETWQAALNEAKENPATLQNLLKNNLDLNIDARISKSLTDKIGLTPMIEGRGAMFVTLSDGEYRLKIENSDGKIKLNGMPLPF